MIRLISIMSKSIYFQAYTSNVILLDFSSFISNNNNHNNNNETMFSVAILSGKAARVRRVMTRDNNKKKQ